MATESTRRQELVDVCRRMHERGYLAATDGNVSARLGDRLLITPSGVSKANLAPSALLVTDMEGNIVSGQGRPSSEIAMHLAAYRARPEIGAVVHGHPPRAIAFTVAGVEIPGRMLPEVVVGLGGRIPTVPYSTPTTDEVPAALAPFLPSHDVMMMEFHGALCLGADPWDGYYKLEKLEHLCEVALYAQALGSARQLSESQVQALLALKGMPALPGQGCL